MCGGIDGRWRSLLRLPTFVTRLFDPDEAAIGVQAMVVRAGGTLYTRHLRPQASPAAAPLRGIVRGNRLDRHPADARARDLDARRVRHRRRPRLLASVGRRRGVVGRCVDDRRCDGAVARRRRRSQLRALRSAARRCGCRPAPGAARSSPPLRPACRSVWPSSLGRVGCSASRPRASASGCAVDGATSCRSSVRPR